MPGITVTTGSPMSSGLVSARPSVALDTDHAVTKQARQLRRDRRGPGDEVMENFTWHRYGIPRIAQVLNARAA